MKGLVDICNSGKDKLKYIIGCQPHTDASAFHKVKPNCIITWRWINLISRCLIVSITLASCLGQSCAAASRAIPGRD